MHPNEKLEEVKEFLDGTDEDSISDDELVDLYESVKTHYEAAVQIQDDDNFEYEVELAYDALESYNVVSDAINKDSYLDYAGGGGHV